MFSLPLLWVTALGFSLTYQPPAPFDNYSGKNDADYDS